MTATDTIRAMLDERGVEYRTHGMTDRTWFDVGYISWFVIERENGGIAVEAVFLTPEQAIEATLGRGECEQEEHGWSTEGDHARVWLTCGHDCMVETVADLPNYCPSCGRKVRA